MSDKKGPLQGKRTTLSLNLAKQQQQQQQLQQQQLQQLQQQQQLQQLQQLEQQQQIKQATVQQTNSNPIAKIDNKATNQKTEPSLADLAREAKKLGNQEKKQLSNAAAAEAQKKSQNGVAKSSTKDKQPQQHQNGNDINNGNEKKEKPERASKQNKEEKKETIEEKSTTKNLTENKQEKKETKQQKKDDLADKKKPLQNAADTELIVENKNEAKAVPIETIVEPPLGNALTSPASAVVEKPSTPVKTPKTPLKSPIKTPIKTPTKTPTQIDSDSDIEMISIVDIETSPKKIDIAPVTYCNSKDNVVPTATSTPGKVSSLISKLAAVATGGTKVDTKQTSSPRTFSQISGRRSIRPLNDYTPTHFQSNMLFRESYRRINTELDVTSTTNTSLNVTVGSEVPNNSSFSFFGRGRKRDRTPPESNSPFEVQNDVELTPPKRARIDVYGLLSAVASPLTLLRSRFSRASIHSTPVKLDSKLSNEDYDEETDVQNVSGILIEEEIVDGDNEQIKTGEDVTVGNEAGVQNTSKKSSKLEGDIALGVDVKADDVEKCVLEKATTSGVTIENDGDDNDDIKITETQLIGAVGDPLAKNKRCSVM